VIASRTPDRAGPRRSKLTKSMKVFKSVHFQPGAVQTGRDRPPTIRTANAGPSRSNLDQRTESRVARTHTRIGGRYPQSNVTGSLAAVTGETATKRFGFRRVVADQILNPRGMNIAIIFVDRGAYQRRATAAMTETNHKASIGTGNSPRALVEPRLRGHPLAFPAPRRRVGAVPYERLQLVLPFFLRSAL
jgi:hypothetical protein